MKASKIFPWVIFGLVLVLASMTIGRSSGYYDGAPGTATAAPPATVAAAPAVMYTTRAQTDYPGNDIKRMDGSLDSCKTACNSDPTCNGFVLRQDGKSCFLKTKMANSKATADWDAYGKPGVDLPEVVASTNDNWLMDHVKWIYQTATDFPGGDLATIPNQYDSTCGRICAQTNGCKGVVRDISRPGVCMLKSSKVGTGTFNRSRNAYFFS